MRTSYIRSTETSRTYQSAIALLFGFLPTFKLSNIDIVLTSKENKKFCDSRKSGLSCRCPSIAALTEIAQKKYFEGTRNITLDAEARDELAKKYKLDGIANSMPIFDTILGSICRGGGLPCPYPTRCLTWDLMNKLMTVNEAENNLRESIPENVQKQVLNAHPLLREIINRMQNVSNRVELTKFVLYSGHDETLKPMLTTLGINDGVWPPYATRLIFELYKDRSPGRQDYFVRVVYNGVDYTKYVRFCLPDTLKRGMCPLSSFVQYANQVTPGLNGLMESWYNKACGL